MRFLHGIAHKSNAGKYFDEYFMTSDITSTYTSFRHAGPFVQPLPTKAMKARAGILASLPSDEKDVKALTSPENLRVAGLFITEHPSSRSESSYEDVDPLDDVSSPAGQFVCPPGPVVIRELTAVAALVVPPSIVHGKGKKVRIPSCSPSSSDDEDSFCDDPLPGHLVVC